MKLTLCKMEACLKNDSSLRCKPCFHGMKAGTVLLLQMRRQHQREQVARVGVKVSPTGLAVEKCCGTIPVVCPPYNLRGMLVGREPSGKPPPSSASLLRLLCLTKLWSCLCTHTPEVAVTREPQAGPGLPGMLPKHWLCLYKNVQEVLFLGAQQLACDGEMQGMIREIPFSFLFVFKQLSLRAAMFLLTLFLMIKYLYE